MCFDGAKILTKSIRCIIILCFFLYFYSLWSRIYSHWATKYKRSLHHNTYLITSQTLLEPLCEAFLVGLRECSLSGDQCEDLRL